MVLPALAVGLIGAGSGLGMLQNGLSYYENRRYWSEYGKNTGYLPRYRARSGYYDYLGIAGSGLKTLGYSYGARRW